MFNKSKVKEVPLLKFVAKKLNRSKAIQAISHRSEMVGVNQQWEWVIRFPSIVRGPKIVIDEGDGNGELFFFFYYAHYDFEPKMFKVTGLTESEEVVDFVKKNIIDFYEEQRQD